MKLHDIDFSQLAQSQYFFDKTELIAQIESERGIDLVIRPHGWFKSSILSMLRLFYSSPEARGLFEGLNVGKNTMAMEAQGKHPVIALDFSDVEATTFDDARLYLQDKMSALYFQFLQKIDQENCLTKYAYQIYKRTLEKTLDKREDFSVTLGNTLEHLSEYVRKAYKIKPVILIDAMDRPYEIAAMHGYLDKMAPLMSHFHLAWAKNNSPNVHYGMITCTSFVTDPSFRLLDLNISIYSDLHLTRHLPYFGLTKSEIISLLGRNALFSLYRTFMKQNDYGGYTSTKDTLYHPAQILAFFNNHTNSATINTSELLHLSPLAMHTVKQAFLSRHVSIEFFIKLLTEENSEPAVFARFINFLNIDKSSIMAYLTYQGILSAKGYTLSECKNQELSQIRTLTIPNLTAYQVIKETFFDNPEFNPNQCPCPPFEKTPSLANSVTLYQPANAVPSLSHPTNHTENPKPF